MLGHNAKLVPGVAGQTAVNSQKGYRTRVDERLSERALREMYLRGFEKMVREAVSYTHLTLPTNREV